MRPSDRVVLVLWREAILDLPSRSPSFFASTMAVMGIMGLFPLWLEQFSSRGLWMTALPVAALLPLSLGATVLAQRVRLKSAWTASLLRTAVRVHMAFYSAVLLVLSTFFLRLAEAFHGLYTQPLDVLGWVIRAAYALSVLAAATWASRSVPVEDSEYSIAHMRSRQWLPLAIGIQGAFVGLGVFIAAWSLHGRAALSQLMVAGGSALGASLLAFFGVLGVYRTLVLIAHPVPIELELE